MRRAIASVEMRGKSGVKLEEIVVGSGAIAQRGDTVQIRYTGYLNRGDAFQKEELITFKIGERRVIAGLEYGVEGMRVGGRRRVHVPPHLGYGPTAVPGIPPNAKLVLDVELLSASAA